MSHNPEQYGDMPDENIAFSNRLHNWQGDYDAQAQADAEAKELAAARAEDERRRKAVRVEETTDEILSTLLDYKVPTLPIWKPRQVKRSKLEFNHLFLPVVRTKYEIVHDHIDEGWRIATYTRQVDIMEYQATHYCLGRTGLLYLENGRSTQDHLIVERTTEDVMTRYYVLEGDIALDTIGKMVQQRRRRQ
jgi:hypothetical protein